MLEEGLDVPACNPVIRFDSTLTLRAIVQGRGRAATRPNSQFVIFCSDDREETFAREAVKKEANMVVNVNTCDPLQALSFGCRIKKPDFSRNQVQESTAESMEFQPTAEEQDMGNDFSEETLTVNERGESLASGGPTKRRKNYVPRIAITVDNGDESKQLGLLTYYFEEYFEVKSINKGESEEMTKTTDETSDSKRTSRCVRLELEPSKQGQLNNKDKFFGYVAQSWCFRSTELLTQTK